MLVMLSTQRFGKCVFFFYVGCYLVLLVLCLDCIFSTVLFLCVSLCVIVMSILSCLICELQ